MKALAILALCAVLYFEHSHGFPLQSLKHRVRRDAEPTKVASPDKRTELLDYAVSQIILLAKNTVEGFRDVIGRVLTKAKAADLKGEDIDKFQKTMNDVNELFKRKIEDEKSIEKLFELFGEIITQMGKFDEQEDLTPEQKPLKQLFDDNNADLLAVKFVLDFMTFRSKLDEHVSAYIEGLTAAEKEKEAKLVDWYAKFKKAEDFDDLIDTTLSFVEVV